MVERRRQIDSFLAAAGWSDAEQALLAGDASGRNYLRLRRPGESAVLMDSAGGDIVPFLRVARHLNGLGYSAPGIYAADIERRLALLEDLGDLSFINHLEDCGKCEAAALYGAAVDLLVDLAAEPLPADARPMDSAYLAAEIRLFADWWPPRHDAEADLAGRAEAWVAAWREAHALALAIPKGLALRDFHAANLFWLPGRRGNRRVGLLDFQDALAAPISYDLVSLLRDVRRDVAEDLQAAMIARFTHAVAGLDAEAFRLSYAVLGAHRNLRIAGVFSRLAGRDGNRAYLRLLPRVWRHIEADLSHPALAPVRAWLDRHVPPEMRGGGR